MTARKTPFQRIHYPWTSDVVAVTDMQTMASDIDQALVQTAILAANFSRFSSVVVKRAAAQSLVKNTFTAISMDTVIADNGLNSPLANGAWFAAGTPTRLTAPSACVVLATASGGVNYTSVPGTAGCVHAAVALNGATGAVGAQGSKYSPYSTITGQIWTSALTMWKLNAGDFLEMKMLWTGTPAGPLSTDTVIPPTLSLMMVGLPIVP